MRDLPVEPLAAIQEFIGEIVHVGIRTSDGVWLAGLRGRHGAADPFGEPDDDEAWCFGVEPIDEHDNPLPGDQTGAYYVVDAGRFQHVRWRTMGPRAVVLHFDGYEIEIQRDNLAPDA